MQGLLYSRIKSRERSIARPSFVVEIIEDQHFIKSIVDHYIDIPIDPNYDILVQHDEVHLHTHPQIMKLIYPYGGVLKCTYHIKF